MVVHVWEIPPDSFEHPEPAIIGDLVQLSDPGDAAKDDSP